MTRTDIRLKFNKEKDLPVLETLPEGTIIYTADYVHWLVDIALKVYDKHVLRNSNGHLIPRPGDYYESFVESNRINSKTGLTWHQQYLNDLKKWNES